MIVGVAKGAPAGLLTSFPVGGSNLGMGPNVGLGIFGVCVGLAVIGVARAHRWDYWWWGERTSVFGVGLNVGTGVCGICGTR
jgi:hypothetical protein